MAEEEGLHAPRYIPVVACCCGSDGGSNATATNTTTVAGGVRNNMEALRQVLVIL